ncbi:hypothetical protein CEQ28_012545 [Hafnia alvei]|nr:hypothetical protein CEQ28_012545 [Hafnia alvei]
MKKIRYLKPTYDASQGEMRFVQAHFARVLVLASVAEYVVDNPVTEQVAECGTHSEGENPAGKKNRSRRQPVTGGGGQ